MSYLEFLTCNYAFEYVQFRFFSSQRKKKIQRAARAETFRILSYTFFLSRVLSPSMQVTDPVALIGHRELRMRTGSSTLHRKRTEQRPHQSTK